MEEGTTGIEIADGWIKWLHEGVPDEENEDREKIRDNLAQLWHCKKCTALSGCYFAENNKPEYPQHPHCDCKLLLLNGIMFGNAYCDIRKFTEYVFTNQSDSKGKMIIFQQWGYEIGNSAYLKIEFEQQAVQNYLSGKYLLNKLDDKGQRITIIISLNTAKGIKKFKTGWMVHPLGKITCATPFSGEIK